MNFFILVKFGFELESVEFVDAAGDLSENIREKKVF